MFIGGDDGFGGSDSDNFYAVLCERAGAGASTYRLYRRRAGGYSYTYENTAGPDCSKAPVRLRLEALDAGSATVVRWWINGVEQTSWVETVDQRITSVSGVTGSSGRSYAGVSWGSGSPTEQTNRRLMRVRAGNMPERKHDFISAPVGDLIKRRVVVF